MDDEDLDFTALMQRQGVAPVRPARADRAGRKAQEPAPRKPGRVAERASVVAPVVTPVERRGAAAEQAGRGTAQAGRGTAQAVLLTAQAELLTARAELLTARAELQAQQHELARTIAARDGLAARVKQLEQERDAALRSLAAAEKLATAKQRTAPAGPPAPAPEVPRISLTEALVARGLSDPDEQAQAVAALTGTESARRLMEALETRDIAGLRSALERRLALVCGSPGCSAPAGAAVIEVSPARCELCGGSEIQRAATRFIHACEAAGVARVRFVGGSPNYRTQLEALFPRRGPLTVHTTAGDRRVPLHRAKAQQRSDDLVVIWGATELDHATSGAYRAQFGRVETIAHRGIGRMLDLAAERITAS